jgi:hypothetical protein
MLRPRNRPLQILVDPNWRDMVQLTDWAYIGEILADFKQRALSDPEALFVQVKSLAVGPLVTHSEGTRVAEHPGLLERVGTFIELSVPLN